MSSSFESNQNHASSVRDKQEFKPVSGAYNNNQSNQKVNKNCQYSSGDGNVNQQKNIETQNSTTIRSNQTNTGSGKQQNVENNYGNNTW
ncbi:hypothetical protein SUGI_1104270 [Cryptomeria japonica]|nr:hypothetical protein SUGI_1104270 [Cryptomeria japonica]